MNIAYLRKGYLVTQIFNLSSVKVQNFNMNNNARNFFFNFKYGFAHYNILLPILNLNYQSSNVVYYSWEYIYVSNNLHIQNIMFSYVFSIHGPEVVSSAHKSIQITSELRNSGPTSDTSHAQIRKCLSAHCLILSSPQTEVAVFEWRIYGSWHRKHVRRARSDNKYSLNCVYMCV